MCCVQGLCNNAGIFNDKDWQKVQQINLDGMLTGTMLAFEKMGVRREERDSERENKITKMECSWVDFVSSFNVHKKLFK